MLSSSTKRNIYRVLPFGLIWLIFSLVYTFLEKGLLGGLDIYPSTGNPYSFAQNIFITPLTALVTGLLMGTIEILYFHKLFLKKSFTQKIIYKSLIYLAVIISFLLITSIIAHFNEQNATVSDKKLWNNIGAFFTSYAFASVVLFMATIVIVSQFYTEVSENIGQGVLANFFTGKYHTPKEEERIFMFLDMRSSTTIAESLGHIKYFDMLREYYLDLSAPIIRHSGEIYQYVGDEVVVSWKLSKGLRNNNCIQCFMAMQRALKKQADKYQKIFGIVPSFKAGFHFGKVTTGEIGVIKKEIIFTGDVLNTTARIQGLCNSFGVDILISGELIKKLDSGTAFEFRSLGQNELRGRDEKIELFTLIKK